MAKKYKQKSNSSAKKRFTITSSGKVKRRRVGMRHLLEHVSSKTKRNKRFSTDVAKSDLEKVKRLLPGIV